MKRLLFRFSFFALVVLSSLSTTFAQSSQTRFFTAYTHDASAIAVTNSAVGLTALNLTPASGDYRAELVIFTVECAGGVTACPLRYTVDGTTPTTTKGNLIDYGYTLSIYNYDNTSKFKAIRTGATSGSIQATYYR